MKRGDFPLPTGFLEAIPLPCHDTMAPHMAPKKSAWMLRILQVGKCGGKTNYPLVN
jgi:hypothetical protein